MNTTSNSQVTRQFSALALATIATVVMLSGINTLATTPAPQEALAAAHTQVVVIEGHRAARV